MDPREIAIASREMVELRLLADPENTERQKTHDISEQARRKLDQSVPQNLLGLNRPTHPQRLLAVNHSTHRDVQVEHKQSHRDGEDPVTQSCQSFETLPRNPVVNCAHLSSPTSQWRSCLSLS